jgi:hypothetical protein
MGSLGYLARKSYRYIGAMPGNMAYLAANQPKLEQQAYGETASKKQSEIGCGTSDRKICHDFGV